MANPIPLVAPTAEAQLVELIGHLQNLERSTTANPQGLNNITGGFNQDTGVFNSNITLNTTPAVNPTTGRIEFEAEEYLQG